MASTGSSSSLSSSSEGSLSPRLSCVPEAATRPDMEGSEHRDGEGSESEDEYAPSPTLLAAYDVLMSAHISPLPLPTPLSSLPASSAPAVPPGADDDPETEEDPNRPMTKAEKQNAKKKRRKERERQLKAAAAAARGEALPTPPLGQGRDAKTVSEPKDIPFRLFSFSSIRPVSLSTEERYTLPTNPRLRPLPDAVRERIARIAAEAAVEAPKPLPAQLGSMQDGPVWVADDTPPAFLAFTSDIETKCTAVPSIRVHLRDAGGGKGETEGDEEGEGEEGGERKKRRCRRRKEKRQFPAPEFWRPPKGVVARGLYGWSL